MKAKLRTLFLIAALAAAPALAQAPGAAPAKPSLFARMKAAATAKPSLANPVATRAAKPTTGANNGQGQRTAKSLACSKEADAKALHGKKRKGFMSHCKRN
jgi:hypothetical protein